MDLHQFVNVLRTRWFFIVSTFVVGSLISLTVAFNQAPVYSSTGRVFVSTPATGVADNYNGTFFAAQRVASYADLATDPILLQKVVDRLSLPMTRTELAGRITAEVVPDTLIIRITATGASPQEAQAIANADVREVIALVSELERPSAGSATPAVVARSTGDASFNVNPSGPNALLNVLVGMMLSGLIGVAGAVLRAQLDRSVKTREDVETLTGGAVMAALPLDRNVRKDPQSVVVPGSPLSEAFRVLRTNLTLASLDSRRQVIVVTSALPGEGKTVTAVNLAQAVMSSGRSVLLVDADMRNPNVANYLGLENAVGMMSVLLGRASMSDAIHIHESGLNVMCTGPRPPNPAEVLETDAVGGLIGSLRVEYDTIIIDAAPLLPVADTSALLRHVDGVLLLVRFGETKREVLKLAAERIDALGGKLYGTVLNGIRRSSAAAYGYGYGYGEPYEPPVKAGARIRQPVQDPQQPAETSEGSRAARR